jgi:biotin transport system substrate-specific component
VPGRARHAVFALIGASIFALLTFLGASIRIPLFPVPFTLQTLFVILAGAVLGSRAGVFSQAIYLSVGILGVPIFAGSLAGIAVFAGPTGGYLVGFMLAAFLVGRLINKRTSLLWHTTVFALGSLAILVCGVAHLAIVYSQDLFSALALGFVPFLLGDTVKVFAAVSIYRSYSHLRRNWSARTRD